jgi:hypothetical protein
MVSKYVRALALRVVYHIQQKLPGLHGQPTRTLVMMVSAFIAAGGPWLSEMGRKLADPPGGLQEKVKRMSRFLCQGRFDVGEAFLEYSRRILETIAHAHPDRMIAVAWDWTDLGDYWGLWLSIPYHGRALPLGCWILEKALAEGGMTLVEQEMLRAFLGSLPEALQRRIVLLADRGFAKSELMQELVDRKIHRVIRQPRNHKVCREGTWKALSWYALRFQIEEMFRDLKSRLHMDRHRLGTEESVAKMMLIVALACLVVLEDGSQWRDRIRLDLIQKSTPWGTLSVYGIARACFDAALPEAPTEVADLIVTCWSNRRAA